MAKESVKVRMKESRGNPAGGPVLRAGAVLNLPSFWAERFVADGAAEKVEQTETPARSAKKGKKNGEGKS